MSKRHKAKFASRARVSALRVEALEQRQLLAAVTTPEPLPEFPETVTITFHDGPASVDHFIPPEKPKEPWRRGRPLR